MWIYRSKTDSDGCPESRSGGKNLHYSKNVFVCDNYWYSNVIAYLYVTLIELHSLDYMNIINRYKKKKCSKIAWMQWTSAFDDASCYSDYSVSAIERRFHNKIRHIGVGDLEKQGAAHKIACLQLIHCASLNTCTRRTHCHQQTSRVQMQWKHSQGHCLVALWFCSSSLYQCGRWQCIVASLHISPRDTQSLIDSAVTLSLLPPPSCRLRSLFLFVDDDNISVGSSISRSFFRRNCASAEVSAAHTPGHISKN